MPPPDWSRAATVQTLSVPPGCPFLVPCLRKQLLPVCGVSSVPTGVSASKSGTQEAEGKPAVLFLGPLAPRQPAPVSLLPELSYSPRGVTSGRSTLLGGPWGPTENGVLLCVWKRRAPPLAGREPPGGKRFCAGGLWPRPGLQNQQELDAVTLGCNPSREWTSCSFSSLFHLPPCF